MIRRTPGFWLRATAWTLTIASSVVTTACGGGGDSIDPYTRPPTLDAGSDADGATSIVVGDGSAPADPSLGGPCLDDGQCNDSIPCTFDVCDFTAGGSDGQNDSGSVGRCRYTTDDAQCADATFCNGRERCVLGVGCQSGPVETCQDQDSCTIDTCVETSKSCLHAPRDLDGDGDPDQHCVAKHDCDDSDPEVSSLHSEVCGNGKDDNCNGAVDELPCATGAADTCATALAIDAPGTYALSTVAAHDDVPLSCASGQDVVALVTVPSGGNKDLDLWLNASNAAGALDVAIGVQSTCGSGATELGCRKANYESRVRVRNVAPGTYAVIAKTSVESALELSVDFLDPTPAATNENCSNPLPITVGTSFPVSLIDPAKDLPSRCLSASGELTYSFTLPSASDVRAYVSVLRGAAVPVLGLRDAACTGASDEVVCHENDTLPLFARALPAGNYVLTVGASSSIDANVTVSASPPSSPDPDESCSSTSTSSPPSAPNGTLNFDLDAHVDDIQDGCFEGNPDAAYSLAIAQPSDVLLVARFPPNDVGAVSLDGSTCTATLACSVADSPSRVRARNLASGSYRAVVVDRLGRSGSLDTLVRPTAAPVVASSSDACTSNVVVIPPEGGFFTGDTTSAMNDFSSGCDQAGSTGSPDVVMRLDLTAAKRVVLDMQGSTYTTLLSVRSGVQCPGLEDSTTCNVGFGAGRSFLDHEFSAGTYWIIVDGFNGESGHFELDVRTLDP